MATGTLKNLVKLFILLKIKLNGNHPEYIGNRFT